jgi:hypothetical protein
MLQAAELTIRLHPEDDVVIARAELPSGTLISKEKVATLVTIPAGHKLAVRDMAQGNPVRRYRSSASPRARSGRATTCTCITSPWATSRATTPFVL